ncbi:hypothetical protein D3C71_2224030 [compost metagenome]
MAQQLDRPRNFAAVNHAQRILNRLAVVERNIRNNRSQIVAWPNIGILSLGVIIKRA